MEQTDPSPLANVLDDFERLEEVAAALVQTSSTMEASLAADARELRQHLDATLANARMLLGVWPPPPDGRGRNVSRSAPPHSGGPVVSGG